MWKVIRRIRFVLNIRRFIPFLLEFFQSKRIPISSKILSVLLVLGYILFPFDLIPDFLAFFGILDDLTVLTFVLQQIVKMAPQELKDKYDVME